MTESLIEKTAGAVSAWLEECGDGSEDNDRETVLRALNHFIDTLEEDLLLAWKESLFRGDQYDLPWRFGCSLDWARRNYPDAGP